MKKLLICLALLLTVLLAAACTGGEDPAVTTGDDTTLVTDPATGEPSEETTDPDPEVTTEEETTEAPFDPTAFEPSDLPVANVAREGYVLASACKNDGGYLNIYLNDGDLSKGFSTPWETNTDIAKAYYVYIDLTVPRKLDSVKIYPLEGDEKAFPKAFDLLVSMDGVNYSPAATVTDTSAEAAKGGLTVSLGGVEAQFVKLVSTELAEGSGRKGSYMALGELEVYAPIDTASNMMLNRHDIWLFKNPDTTQKLEVLYYRDGTAVSPDARLRFVTMDASVAAVDENGLITPVGYGETDVYVTDGTHLAVCHVEVKEEIATDFRVTTFYHSSFAYPEQIPAGLDVLAAAGIEYIEDTRAYDRAGNSISMYSLYLCDQRGIAYSPCDPEGGHGFLRMKEERILEIVQKYENRAGFFGIYLADEPHEEYMEFAKVFHLIQEYNPHLIPHLNLLPPYNFGGIDEYFTEFAAVAGGNGRMKYLSYDHYPFLWGGGFNTQVYSSINRLRKAGLFYNASTGFYMQSMVITGSYREMSDTDLMYNASLGMAYGIKNFKWFVALTPIGSGESFTTGLVAPDFTPSTMHAGVTAANKYIKVVGSVLGNSDAIEVYHTTPEGDNLTLPSDFLFTHVGGGNAIYTLYQSLDGENRQHIVVTNKNFAADGEVTLQLKVNGTVGELKRLNLSTGEMETLTVAADGSFDLTIPAGQCAVIALPEGVDASRPAPEKPENLALNKPVFASSSSATFWEKSALATYFLTDGTPENGVWLGHSSDREVWLKLDLLEVCEIDTVRVYMNEHLTKGQRCKSFTVLVSEDGVSYTEVAKVSNYDWDDVTEALELTFDKVNARYIRIEGGSGRTSGFGEIEVYG